MNYENPTRPTNLKKAAKCLIGFCALFLGLFSIFYSPDTSSLPTLPDCATISGTAQPGFNCLFFSSALPLCQSVPSATYAIDSGYVLTSGWIHRANCADLSDLPLCTQLPSNTTLVGKNCVSDCSSDSSFVNPDPNHSPAYVRGTDYAIHNRDCVRFCDAIATENTSFSSSIVAKEGVNCVSRKCHQMPSDIPPNPTVSPTNCTSISCNLLTVNELDLVAGALYTIGGTAPVNNYCDGEKDINGDSMKCYKFTKAQLPHLMAKSMCQVHDCKPTSETCGVDDTLNITSNAESGYATEYIKDINGNLSLETTGICNPVLCKAIINRPYRCTPTDDTSPTTRNENCDLTGSGATCASGYCYKTIDCNLDANVNESECLISSPSEDGTIGSDTDTMKSWFYRPKPMDKATSSAGVLNDMHNDPDSLDTESLCYNQSHLDTGDCNTKSNWGEHMCVTIDLTWMGAGKYTVDLGYYHSYLLPDQTRSPGKCFQTSYDRKDGYRGTGYVYLCGNGGNLYSNISDYTAYHKGYVVTEFSNADATHKLNVCLRFKNSMRPDDGTSETCGARECGISCAFSICTSQVCGSDVCRELTVKDLDPYQCRMNGELFTNNDSTRDCQSIIDTYLRVRAVKYSGNRICTFLDVKGQLAYPDSNPLDFFTGSETLDDGTCVSGTNKSTGSGCSDSQDTSDDEGEATRWRTLLHIPYIQNNRPDTSNEYGRRGYLDIDGQLFKEQECIKTMLRIAPPRWFNLANSVNSVKLFTPPIYINSAILNGSVSLPEDGSTDAYGTTDFHYPEMEVKFGGTTQRLKLDFGYTGDEEVNPSDTTISTVLNDITYSLEIFVKKSYTSATSQPTFCLYRKLKDQNGVYLSPLRIGCINRNFPDIDNAVSRISDPSLTPNRISLYADATNSFDSSRIVMRYLGGFGDNNVDNSCTIDDICSPELKLENTDSTTETCDSTMENYPVCAQREECTQLNVECIQNEIDMQTAQNSGLSTTSYLAVRKNCTSFLLPLCNAKKGLATSDDASMFTDTNPASSSAITNHYGWFNEICISSGFETKLKQVLSYKMSDGTKGKCVTPGDSCSDGGKAPNCLCQEAYDGAEYDEMMYEVRTETPHEAGLCVDMPLPQTCPAVDYNTTVNPDTTDPEFVASSLNLYSPSGYGATVNDISNVVHISHKYRKEGSVYGYAEFPASVFGMSDISGECKGYWQETTLYGVNVAPKLSCLNSNGTAAWSTTVSNACIRYSCPEISTTGPDESGNYQGDYGSLETGEDKGLSNGFAAWQSYTKTNDFSEIITSTPGCITGFKKKNSVAVVNSAGKITSYSGGSPIARPCNQLGSWVATVTNSCQRISCSAVSPRIPGMKSDGVTAYKVNGVTISAEDDSDAWSQWDDSGGATYPSVNASRSSLRIQAESIATGTCNNSLGFFKVGQTDSDPSSGISPTRECDVYGNWSDPINPCTTKCDAVTIANSSSGNAYWNEVRDVPLEGEADGVITTSSGNSGCLTGYYPYPYPSLKDKYGAAFTVSTSGPYRTDSGSNKNLTKIPKDVTLDTRAAGYPQRVCESIVVVGGSANVWTTPSSSCTNVCPGSTVDSRLNVGTTSHSATSGTVTLSWPSTSFGQTAYVANPGGTNSTSTAPVTGQMTSDYDSTRTDGYYVVSRYCNSSTHKWDDPVVQCVSNGTTGGSIDSSNAVYSTTTNTVNVGSSPTTSACLSGYYKADQNTAAITNYECSYKDSKNRIDEVYFKEVSPQTGSDCAKFCLVTDSTFSSKNEKYPSTLSTTLYVPIDTGTSGTDNKILLTCTSSSYGSTITGISSTSAYANCGRPTSDRTTNQPYALCTGTSTPTLTYYNECSACRDCTSSSSLSANTSKVTDNESPDYIGVAANSLSATGYSSGQENCGSKTTDIDSIQTDLMDHCKNSDFNSFSISHNSCFRMEFDETWSCSETCDGGVGSCTRHTDLNSAVRLQCIDNAFVPINSSSCSNESYSASCRSF